MNKCISCSYILRDTYATYDTHTNDHAVHIYRKYAELDGNNIAKLAHF